MPLTSQETEREPLRWLFAAHFKDGSELVQTQEDKSTTKESGSAFTDVLARAEELVAFSLFNGETEVLVDLITGNFVVNGVPVSIHNQYFNPEKYKLELVYFRETRVERVSQSTIQEDSTVTEEQIGDVRHYVNRYFIGWKTRVNGKDKQVTLAVG